MDENGHPVSTKAGAPKIVTGTDGSPSAMMAVRHALSLAHSQRAMLEVVAAYPPGDSGGEERARTALDLTRRALNGTDVAVAYHSVPGTPTQALVTHADEIDAALIVVGNRESDSLLPWRRAIFEKVERAAHCPVVVVNTESEWQTVRADPSRPPRIAREWQVLLVTMVAVFMALLDVTIVNVAFPDMQNDFATTPLSDLSWILNAYNVVFAAMLVPAGRLADRRGRRRIFFAGLYLFVLGSVLCAVAPIAELLIAARVVQAVGAACLIPTSLGLLLPEFAPEKRSMAVSLWAAAGAVAAAAGPSLGGVLVDAGGWRWAFIVNVIMLAVLPVAKRVLIERRDSENVRASDVLGGGLMAAAIGLLALGIVKAPDWGWTDPGVLASWAAAVVLLAVLLMRSRKHPSPVLEPELLRIKSFATASLATLVYSTGFYALLLCNVLFLTQVWGYSVLGAGFGVTPGPIAAAIGAAVAGHVAEHKGPRAVVVPAALVSGIAFMLYRDLPGAEPSYLSTWLPCQIVSGAAAGMVFAAVSTATVMDLPTNRIATGTALASSLRQIGAVLGVATLVAVLGTPTPETLLDAFDTAYGFMAVTAVAAALVATRLPSGAPRVLGEATPLRSREKRRDIPGLTTRDVVVGGRTIVYRTGGSGPPLVLIHGLVDSGMTWRKIAPILALRHTVYVPDLAGHGDSEVSPFNDYAIGSHALIVHGLMEELGIERAALVGHSLGASVATFTAWCRPDGVHHLALVSPGGIGRELAWPLRLAALPGVNVVVRGAGSRPVIFTLRLLAALASRCKLRGVSRAIRNGTGVLSSLADAGARTAFVESARAVINLHGQKSSMLPLLTSLRIPLFVLWGSRDRVIPSRHLEIIKGRRPDVPAVLVDGAGHSPHLSHTAQVAELITDWLTSQQAAVYDDRLDETESVRTH